MPAGRDARCGGGISGWGRRERKGFSTKRFVGCFMKNDDISNFLFFTSK